jgi:sugar lactone lactonase YvrE
MRRLPNIFLFLPILLVVFGAAGCGGRAGLERPNGVAVAADQSLYIMDFGHYRIVHAGEDGRLLKAAGQFGPKPEQIYFGWDMAIDSRGNLYFGNTIRDDEGTRHDGIKVFSPEGKFLREIGEHDYPRQSDETAYLPYGVEVDSQNRVYTADYGADTVRIFSPSGALLGTLSGADQPGYQFTNPGDVAVDDPRSLMYVTDFTLGSLLQFKLSFAADGKPEFTFLKSFGEYGRKSGQFAFPQNLAVDDASGTVYVGDMASRRVQAFDPQGKFLAIYAPPSVRDWQVLGLAVGPDGRVYAGDALNNTVWIFSPSGQPPKPVEVKP